jgi:predicted transglutaminase-like cysteine proteinase
MTKVRLAVFLIGIIFFVGTCGCCSKASAKPTDSAATEFKPLIPPGTGLFGSHEFRSTLRALPNWTRVMGLADAQTKELSACDPTAEVCSSAALSWQRIINESQGKSGLDLLTSVNSYFNRWPYSLDIDVYGKDEYWATPGEFLRLSGDCEDYSITKYYALRQLGYPVEKMRVVLLKDTIRNLSHAVLAVELNGDTMILDNMSDLVLTHKKYTHYLPQYSVNENYRWAHVSPSRVR